MSEVIYHRCDMCGGIIIDEYQMVNGYKTDIERRPVADGELRNSCETAAKRSEAEEDAHGC